MKVFLLHRDQDFDVKPELRDAIFDAMLSGNMYALTNVRREARTRAEAAGARAGDNRGRAGARISSSTRSGARWRPATSSCSRRPSGASSRACSDPEAIVYRQRVLADCLEQPAIVRQIYDLAIEALESETEGRGVLWHSDRPDTILHRSVQVLKLHVDVLKRLRQIADEQAEGFHSDGFTRFFAMLSEELADDYLQTVEAASARARVQTRRARERRARQGQQGPPLRRPTSRPSSAGPSGCRSPTAPELQLHDPARDQSGFKALEEIRGRGINHVANAVAQSADHIKSFFAMLRLELAFYLGCLNLHERLDDKGEPTCFPTPLADGQLVLAAEGLYDVCLTLHLETGSSATTWTPTAGRW